MEWYHGAENFKGPPGDRVTHWMPLPEPPVFDEDMDLFYEMKPLRMKANRYIDGGEVSNMPNKNGKGPKGNGPRDGHGGGKGKGTGKGAGPKTGGKKGKC
jgi:hypothetical protein